MPALKPRSKLAAPFFNVVSRRSGPNKLMSNSKLSTVLGWAGVESETEPNVNDSMQSNDNISSLFAYIGGKKKSLKSAWPSPVRHRHNSEIGKISKCQNEVGARALSDGTAVGLDHCELCHKSDVLKVAKLQELQKLQGLLEIQNF